MDEEYIEEIDPSQYLDPVCQRALTVLKMAKEHGSISSTAGKAAVEEMMTKLVRSIKLPPQAELLVIEGGKPKVELGGTL